MTTILTLAVKLVADASAYTKAMDKAERRARSFSGNVTTSLSKVGGSFLKIGSTIGSTFVRASRRALIALGAIETGLAALGTKAFLEAARVDELRVVNEQLAKNAGIALSAVRKEAKEVRGMGIEAAIAERAVSEFIKAQLDMSKASDLARVAQDAAVISQTNSSEAFNNILLGIVKLNPEILRTQGIVMSSKAAFKTYADSIGKNVKELTAAEQQQAFLNAVMAQGVKISGAYEAAMKEPGKVLRSFPRYFNDIFVSIGKILKPAFGESVFAVASLVKGFGKAIQEGGILRPVIERLAQAFIPFIKFFSEAVKKIDFEIIAKKAMPIIDKFVSFIESGLRVVKQFVLAFNHGGIQEFFVVLEDGSGAIVSLLNLFGLSGNKAVEMAIKIRNVFNWMRDSFAKTITTLQQDKGIIVAILAMIGTAIGAFVYTTVIPAAIAIVSAMLPIVVVMAAVGAVAYLLYTAWTKNWGGIQEKTKAAAAFVKKIIGSFTAAVRALWDKHGAQILSTVIALWMQIKIIFGKAVAVVRAIFEAFSAAFSGDWYTFGAKLREAWDAAWDLITTVVRFAWANIKLAVGKLIENVVNFFKTTNWREVGMNIIRGIVSGLNSLQQWAINQIVAIGQNMMGAFKGFFGIRSPSKLMENLIGKNLALGLTVGFEKNLNPLAMRPAMAGAVSGVAIPAISAVGAASPGRTVQIVVPYQPMFPRDDEYTVARALGPAIRRVMHEEGVG